MKNAIATSLLLFSAIPIASARVDLNSPVNQTPTVKSEIIRGIRGADDCAEKTLSPSGFSGCVLSGIEKDEQAHSNDKFFVTGMYFGAWINEDMLASTAKSSNMPSAEREARSQARMMYSSFLSNTKKCGLAVADLVSVAPFNKGYLNKRLRYWKAADPKGQM